MLKKVWIMMTTVSHPQREYVTHVRDVILFGEEKTATNGSISDCFGLFCWVDAGWLLCTSLQLGCFSGVLDADSAGEGCGAQGRILAPASACWVSSSILEEASGPPGTLAGWVGPFCVPFWLFW